MMGYYGGYGMGYFGFVFMVLITAVLILLIVWLIRELQTPKRRR